MKAMTEATALKRYEGMFLINPSAASDWDSAEQEVRRVLERAEASIVAIHKWHEGKLAYEIEGVRRGLYALAYFDAPPEKIRDLERDVQLSEVILRALILRADYVTEEMAKNPIPGPAGSGRSREGRRRGPREDRGKKPAEEAAPAAEPAPAGGAPAGGAAADSEAAPEATGEPEAAGG